MFCEVTAYIYIYNHISNQFDERLFTQIDGATIGSLDSGSITDIYGDVHIDQVLIQQYAIVPQNYKRYSDNTIDVCKNSSQEEQECITDWMNENTEKDKIKFSIECIGEEVKFLNTKVNVVNISKEGEEKTISACSQYVLKRHRLSPISITKIMSSRSYRRKHSNNSSAQMLNKLLR